MGSARLISRISAVCDAGRRRRSLALDERQWYGPDGMRKRSKALVCAALVMAGCSSDEAKPKGGGSAEYVLKTTSFDVPAGQEKYLCYAQTLDEDLVIDRFDYAARPVIHHFLLSKAITPEPEGFSECNVLFRSSWVPIFIAGFGDATLSTPEGTGHILKKGTQLVVQLHLLNGTAKDVTDNIDIHMHRASNPDVDPVGVYAFGTNKISLPPNKATSVKNDCVVDRDVDIFAFLPHMHTLGVALSLEAGPDDASMTEVYRKDPWDFDQQEVVSQPLKLQNGTHTRITCHYDNPTNQSVAFGESSFDEMCFLIGFARKKGAELDGCVNLGDPVGDGGVPPSPDAGVCGEQQPNSLGIGAACTAGGNECGAGLSCSADQDQAPAGSTGFCLKIGGCNAQADCGGGGATCCSPAQAGGLINICLPEACRPADCIPK